MHLEGGGAWFFGCWLDLLIEQAWLRVLAVVNLRSSEASWSSCREVCCGRKVGDRALGDVPVVRQAVACVAGWTGSANEPIAVRTRPKTLLQVSRTGEGDRKRADDGHGQRAERATDDGSGHDMIFFCALIWCRNPILTFSGELAANFEFSTIERRPRRRPREPSAGERVWSATFINPDTRTPTLAP